ncbi:hypothetical protein D3C72_2162300 [compost metagenome]
MDLDVVAGVRRMVGQAQRPHDRDRVLERRVAQRGIGFDVDDDARRLAGAGLGKRGIRRGIRRGPRRDVRRPFQDRGQFQVLSLVHPSLSVRCVVRHEF